MVQPLGPPETFYLKAAVGWLELGNAGEAAEELAHIRPEFLEHPGVLEVRWLVCSAGNSWEAGLAIAELQIQTDPDKSNGWVNRAYALRRIRHGSLQRAWDALRPAFEKFPKEPIIPYNLACYAAQFGRLDEAWDWLHRAMEAAGDVKSIKEMALRDRDLEPLWERVKTL
jgi:Flp pilus assembly protein TadD